MTNNNNNNNNNHRAPECQEHFRLFSYLAMAILTIAILVGLFLIIQHLSEEEEAAKSIANQESVLKNQKLLLELNKNQTDSLDIALNSQKNLLELIKITNQNNSEFFAILENMTKAEMDELLEINVVNEKVDKIIKYQNIKD